MDSYEDGPLELNADDDEVAEEIRHFVRANLASFQRAGISLDRAFGANSPIIAREVEEPHRPDPAYRFNVVLEHCLDRASFDIPVLEPEKAHARLLVIWLLVDPGAHELQPHVTEFQAWGWNGHRPGDTPAVVLREDFAVVSFIDWRLALAMGRRCLAACDRERPPFLEPIKPDVANEEAHWKEMILVTDAAEEFGIARSTIYGWCPGPLNDDSEKGEDGRLRVNRSAVRDHLEKPETQRLLRRRS